MNTQSKMEKKTNSESKELENITTNDFYCQYYKPVRENIIIKSKNSEYCVIRDIVFTIFIITIVVFILTLIWPKYFYKELIAGIVSYIVGVISCKMKSRDLVSQIVVEKINKEGNEESVFYHRSKSGNSCHYSYYFVVLWN